ncbi:hypothetical protein ONZ45_g9961 [Pleurotus djamor]|nr:hypothetical protein ONZ45_g9961 [Pleurotus djamor]
MFDYGSWTFGSICFHSLLYGLYIVLVCISCYVLLPTTPSATTSSTTFNSTSDSSLSSVYKYPSKPKAHPSRINNALLVSSVVLFGLITSHWVLQFLLAYDGLIKAQPPTANNGGFGWKYVACTAITLAEVAVADVMMMYRLYAIWGGQWMILIPSTMTFLTSLAVGIKSIVALAQTRDAMKYYQDYRLEVMILCSAELATNLIITLLIASRILFMNAQARKASPAVRLGSNITPLVGIIVESASIFTSILVVILVAFILDSDLDTFALQFGISFSLIIIRVTLHSQNQHQRYQDEHGRRAYHTASSTATTNDTEGSEVKSKTDSFWGGDGIGYQSVRPTFERLKNRFIDPQRWYIRIRAE